MSLEFNIDSIGYTPEKGGGGSITPSGTKSISENGVYDVTYFAKASVNVEGTVPTGTTTITANGTYDVTAYANASVNVEGSEPTLVTKTITENGTYAASSDNADGYSSVSVNVAGTTPTGTYTITTNGTYDVTNYANADVNVSGGGGGSGVYRGNWLVPQEYIDLDAEVTRIHNSLNPTFTAGFYFNKSDNGFNTFTFNPNDIGENFKCFSANGEKTMTPNETFSYYSDVVLANNENYLIFTFDGDVGSAYFSTFFLFVNNNASKDVIFAPQRQAMKYITAMGQLNKSSDFLSPVSYLIPNLDEIHPLTNGIFATNLNNLNKFVGFKYVPSVTEYDYGSSTYTDTNDVFKVIARLQNLPDGADFSNLTNDWNFAATLDNYPMYITFIRLNRMYITLPKGNITFNNSVTNQNQYGINLTADNWTYIAQHAPTVSGKTIKISAYNESQLGSANKAILQSKGWTVTVI